MAAVRGVRDRAQEHAGQAEACPRTAAIAALRGFRTQGSHTQIALQRRPEEISPDGQDQQQRNGVSARRIIPKSADLEAFGFRFGNVLRKHPQIYRQAPPPVGAALCRERPAKRAQRYQRRSWDLGPLRSPFRPVRRPGKAAPTETAPYPVPTLGCMPPTQP